VNVFSLILPFTPLLEVFPLIYNEHFWL